SVVGPSLWGMQIDPAVCQAMGQGLTERAFERSEITTRAVIAANGRGEIVFGSKVDRDWSFRAPIRRNLQNCGTAETAVGKQHFFAKALLSDCCHYLCRNTAE